MNLFEDDYPNNLDMEKFERVDSISSYNQNYYIGVKKGDVLYGESYCSENDKLYRYKEPCT